MERVRRRSRGVSELSSKYGTLYEAVERSAKSDNQLTAQRSDLLLGASVEVRHFVGAASLFTRTAPEKAGTDAMALNSGPR